MKESSKNTGLISPQRRSPRGGVQHAGPLSGPTALWPHGFPSSRQETDLPAAPVSPALVRLGTLHPSPEYRTGLPAPSWTKRAVSAHRPALPEAADHAFAAQSSAASHARIAPVAVAARPGLPYVQSFSNFIGERRPSYPAEVPAMDLNRRRPLSFRDPSKLSTTRAALPLLVVCPYARRVHPQAGAELFSPPPCGRLPRAASLSLRFKKAQPCPAPPLRSGPSGAVVPVARITERHRSGAQPQRWREP